MLAIIKILIFKEVIIMPRAARIKGSSCIYHIMVRSNGGVMLFRDTEDKERFMHLIKKYQDIFMFRVYAYCLMDNHAHFIIDSSGADISKIMHGINQSYAQYFNRKHGSHGHVFQDRFKSKIVKNEKYFICLSAYIHNNPKNIKSYVDKTEHYIYSSLGVYIGIRKDPFGILSTGFLLSLYSQDARLAKIGYVDFVNSYSNSDMEIEAEFKNERSQLRSERCIIARMYKDIDIIKFAASKLETDMSIVHIKYSKKATQLRAIAAFLMRCLCDFKCRDICKALGGVSQSRVSKLCCIGLEVIRNDEKYNNLIQEFLETEPAA
jgi:REP element-mobilizing transposase RayT